MIRPLSELKFGKYGTVAQDIFDNISEEYGWDKSLRNEFGMYGVLYAKNVDADRTRGLWFISKSNLTGYKADPRKDKWENTIEALTIKEEYFHNEVPEPDDTGERIVFVRQKIGNDYVFNYYYKGIYYIKDTYSNENGNIVRIYEAK